MGDKVKLNFYVEASTERKLEDLARLTFRGKNGTIDWLVDEAWKRLAANFDKEAIVVEPCEKPEEPA